MDTLFNLIEYTIAGRLQGVACAFREHFNPINNTAGRDLN